MGHLPPPAHPLGALPSEAAWALHTSQLPEPPWVPGNVSPRGGGGLRVSMAALSPQACPRGTCSSPVLQTRRLLSPGGGRGLGCLQSPAPPHPTPPRAEGAASLRCPIRAPSPAFPAPTLGTNNQGPECSQAQRLPSASGQGCVSAPGQARAHVRWTQRHPHPTCSLCGPHLWVPSHHKGKSAHLHRAGKGLLLRIQGLHTPPWAWHSV